MTESGGRRLSALSWVRMHWIPVGLLSVVLAGLVVLTVIAFGGSRNLPSDAGHPAGSAAAQAATATEGSKWLVGSQARPLTAVNADLGRVLAGERAGSRSAAAKAAGARLAADAAAALHGPMPPVAAAAYRSALTDLERAGSLVAGGQPGPATPLLNAGEADLMRVTSAADQPVAVNTPAAPEPGG